MYKQLEFQKILELLSSHALSAEAKAMVYGKKLSSDVQIVEKRLIEVEEAVNILTQKSHVPFLVLDKIGNLMTKVEKGYILTPEELVEYADFLRGIKLIRRFFEQQSVISPTLSAYASCLNDQSTIEESIYAQVNKTTVYSTANRELGKYRQRIDKLNADIQTVLAKFMKKSANQDYIQEKIVVEKLGRYTVPIKSSFKNKVDGIIVDESHKGVTVYVEPYAVNKLSSEKELWEAKEQEIVYQILCALTELVYNNLSIHRQNLEIMVELDFIFARAKFARTYEGRRVAINKENRLILDNVKHPLIENAVPLSLSIGVEHTALVITGMNAGGKTVTLKTVGLLTLMTMYGMLIPSGKHSDIALMDNIFVSIGDNQSIDHSLSTFSAEMTQLASILNHVTPHSLVLLDELGSGTDPKEGTALAIAILHRLYLKHALVFATTHYGDIKQYALDNPHFITAAMDFDVQTLTPKYRLIMNDVGESKAFWVAKRAGIQQVVLESAQNILDSGNFPSEYLVTLPTFEQKKQTVEQKDYQKGDVVWVSSLRNEALFFEYLPTNHEAKVFVDKKMVIVPLNHLSIRRLAKDLYPKGYQLDLLFIEDYQDYKFQKDLRRGSKKAWKTYRKMKEKGEEND